MKSWLAYTLALAIIMVGAPPSYSGGSTVDGIVTVDIARFNFTPPEIHIRAGQTLKWINKDVFVHTVTSGVVEKGRRDTAKHPDGKFDSGDIKQEKSYTRTFREKGTYPYYCDTHPFMEGKIVVE